MDTDKILPALAKAQAAYPKVEKTASGHHGRYVDMAGLMESVRAANTAAGLIVLHASGVDEHGSYCETRVYHVESGQFISARLRIDPALSDQSLGKSLTYFRRYNTLGLLGIVAGEDTDSQEADDEQKARKAKQKKKAAAKKPAAQSSDASQNWWAVARQIMSETLSYRSEQENAVRAIMQSKGIENSADMQKKGLGGEVLAELRKIYQPPDPSEPRSENQQTADKAGF